MNNSLIIIADIVAIYDFKKIFYVLLYFIIQKIYINNFDFIQKFVCNFVNAVSWIWQLCTQFAQWQVANILNICNLISCLNNLETISKYYCRELHLYAFFQADVDELLKLSDWYMKSLNVMFMNDEIDFDAFWLCLSLFKSIKKLQIEWACRKYHHVTSFYLKMLCLRMYD